MNSVLVRNFSLISSTAASTRVCGVSSTRSKVNVVIFFYLRARFSHFFSLSQTAAPKYREFEFMCTNSHFVHEKIEILQLADRIAARKKSENVSILVDFVLISSIQFRVTGKFEIFLRLPVIFRSFRNVKTVVVGSSSRRREAESHENLLLFLVSLFCSSSVDV